MQSHTSSVHTLSNSTAHSATHFTSDICRKSGTSRLSTLFLIHSEPSAKKRKKRKVGGCFQSRADERWSLKAAVMGEDGGRGGGVHALPRRSFFRQSQPSCQPQARHYHRTTMLHIKQALTEIKESAHDRNTPDSHPLRGTLKGQVQPPGDEVKMVPGTVRLIQNLACKQGNLLNEHLGDFQLTMSFFFLFLLKAFHCRCHGNMVWKSASNWYQFLSRAKLSGVHEINRFSVTGCRILKARVICRV